MTIRSQRGQITTENAVIAGLVVTATIAVLALATPYVRLRLQLMATCVISDICVETDIGGPSLAGDGTGGRSGGAQGASSADGIELECLPGEPQRACVGYEGALCEPGSWSCWWLNADDLWRAAREVLPRAGCGILGGVVGGSVGWSIFGVPGVVVGFVPGVVVGAANCTPNFQDWKATSKRTRCCKCGQEAECDGTVETVRRVRCVLNDSDGFPSDVAESQVMIDEVTRMIRGEPYQIHENDAIKTMKAEIMAALKGPSGPDSRIELVAHSQGAAVLANAVWQLYQDDELKPVDLSRLDIVIMGPAEFRFPPGSSVVAYDNTGAGQPGVGDPINDFSEIYRRLRSAQGTYDGAATPSWRKVQWSCGWDVLACHDMQTYSQAHAQWLRDNPGTPLPSTSIVVNGIKTEKDAQLSQETLKFEGDDHWKYKGNCMCYSAARYDGGACSSDPPSIATKLPDAN